MNWYIGQEIVCVKIHSQGLIKRGKTYIVSGLQMAPCGCKHVLIAVGIRYDYSRFSGKTTCTTCGCNYDSNGISWFKEFCFAPLDQDIRELTEILEKENVVKI